MKSPIGQRVLLAECQHINWERTFPTIMFNNLIGGSVFYRDQQIIFFFIFYTSFLVEELEIFNQTNLRFYFYFTLAYLTVDYLKNNNNRILEFFEPLSIVMIANFGLILFQISLPGTIDGWISNNTDSTNYFDSGRLGGFQGGGPNVIGIFCAIYSMICFSFYLF